MESVGSSFQTRSLPNEGFHLAPASSTVPLHSLQPGARLLEADLRPAPNLLWNPAQGPSHLSEPRCLPCKLGVVGTSCRGVTVGFLILGF